MQKLRKNDRLARRLILGISFVVFLLVGLMRRYKIPVPEGFNTYVFADLNAIINSLVSVLLLVGLLLIKAKNINAHKNVMLAALGSSVLFLLSYVAYHFTTTETPYGGEGLIKIIYQIILYSHILLAGLVLPFILFSVYRALIGEYDKHKKLVRWVWPVWFYVSVTGVIVYFMISQYYPGY